MKKTLVLVLALALVLTMGVIAFAESVSENGEIAAEETVEAVEETIEEPAEELIEEPVEEPAEEPVEEPAEEPAEEPVEEPAEEPDGVTPEEKELKAWLASLPASWNATKEEFTFAFILSRLYEYGEEDGAVYVFKNNGTQTVTLTLAEQYWRYTPTPDAVEAMMKDPNVSAPYAMYTAQIITVEIPVGETVRLSLNPELLATSVYGVYSNVSATYGSLSASIE